MSVERVENGAVWICDYPKCGRSYLTEYSLHEHQKLRNHQIDASAASPSPAAPPPPPLTTTRTTEAADKWKQTEEAGRSAQTKDARPTPQPSRLSTSMDPVFEHINQYASNFPIQTYDSHGGGRGRGRGRRGGGVWRSGGGGSGGWPQLSAI